MARAIATLACMLAAVTARAQQAPPPPPPPAPATLGPEPSAPPPRPPRDEQASQRLHKAIATTAALPSCSFVATWGPDEKGPQRTTVIGGAGSTGKAIGEWQGDEQHLAIGDDELRRRGGAMIAKDANSGWVARTGHFADGNATGFVPAPARLLRALAAMDLAVTARAPASIDDRPVEVATASLDAQQYSSLVWDDLLPDLNGGMIVFGGVGGVGNRAVAPLIEATIDLAVHFDPGTGNVRRVHVRSYRKNAGAGRFVVRGGGQILVAGGAVRGQVKLEDVTDAEDDENGARKPADEGLPERPRKDLVVDDFVLDLTQHGTASLPALDEQGERLLAR